MAQENYPCERTAVPTECEAGWAPQLFCRVLENRKLLASAGIWTLDHPTCSKSLYQLRQPGSNNLGTPSPIFSSVHNHLQAVTLKFKPNICQLQSQCTNNITREVAICHNPLTILQGTEKLDWFSIDLQLSKLHFYTNIMTSNFFSGHNILEKGVFVTLLSSKEGMSVWQIVWVTTNCCSISDT